MKGMKSEWEKRAGFSRPIKGTYADKEERDKLKFSIAS